MCKKTNLSLLTLLCMLFCASFTQAQERLWGISNGTLFSVNKDGSDLKSFGSFSDERYGTGIFGYTTLPSGEIYFTTPFEAYDSIAQQYFFGRINKISANGVDTLYNLGYFAYNGSWGATTSADGKPYIPSGWSKLSGVFIVDPVNDAVTLRKLYTQPFSADYYLTSTPVGIFALSRGNTGNPGRLFKLNPAAPGGYEVIYTFTGGTDGDRPVDKLYVGADGYLFGRTERGGINNKGIYFKIKFDGSSFTKLYDVATGMIDQLAPSGRFERLVALMSQGFLPQRDSEGVIFLNTPSGIYQVDDNGFPILKVTSLTSERITFITPSFNHHVNVNNIPPSGVVDATIPVLLNVNSFRGANSYDLQISTSPDFTSDVQTLSNTSVSFMISSLLSGTTYYTRARPDIYPHYGDVISFSTVVSPVITSNRLWTFSGGGLPPSSSVQGDDLHTFESTVFSEETGPAYGAYPLSNGQKIVIGGGGSFGFGQIWKVTAQGIVKLYDIPSYADDSFISETMIDGEDGYVYALRSGVINDDVHTIIRFAIDGSSYSYFSANVDHIYRYSQIVKTTYGIFGVSRGINSDKGFIYKFKTAETGFERIYDFTVDSLGIRPEGELTEGRDGNLYGTARTGGRNGAGVIFRIRPDGTNYTVLHHFKPSSGKNPKGKLLQDSDGWFYGTTPYGGSGPFGIIFKIFEDGTGFQKLANFSNNGGNISPVIAVDDEYIYASSGNTAFVYTKNGVLVDQISGFTDVWKINSTIAPDTYITSISEGETNVPSSVDVTVKSIYGTTYYAVAVSETSNFTSSTVFTSTEETVHLVLEEGKTYYSRVFTSLLPDPGAVRSFTTAASFARIRNTVEAYPNPSRKSFTLNNATSVEEVLITDLSGNLLYQNNAWHEGESFGEHFRKGMYILTLRTKEGKQTVRLVKE